MFFRGREITHKERGEKIIKRFIEDISDVGEVERNDGLERNVIHLYFQQNAASKKESAKAEKKAKVEQVEEGTENAKTQNEQSS
jgi:translation initiation factor IF-3